MHQEAFLGKEVQPINLQIIKEVALSRYDTVGRGVQRVRYVSHGLEPVTHFMAPDPLALQLGATAAQQSQPPSGNSGADYANFNPYGRKAA